jgi:hypothetical protein
MWKNRERGFFRVVLFEKVERTSDQARVAPGTLAALGIETHERYSFHLVVISIR